MSVIPSCALRSVYARLLASSSLAPRYCSSSLSLTQVTRYYAKTDAPFPPAPPYAIGQGYSKISEPGPPPPPFRDHLTIPPPSPLPLEHMGWHAKQHFECSFFSQVEFSVDQSVGYTDAKAATRFECCNKCGNTRGCQDFVYQHTTGMCVLLPHVPADQVIQTPNEHVISGSLRIIITTDETRHHGICNFEAQSGYANGFIGEAAVPKGQKPIATKQACRY